LPIEELAVDNMAIMQASLRKPVLPDLAALRQARGISLAQISEATKIRVYYLRAIEESRFGELPGGVFNTSYIRQYARAIDYDECDLLASYDSTLPCEEPEEIAPQRGFFAAILRSPVLRLLVPR
jgi:cytoskeletal protein RodZ